MDHGSPLIAGPGRFCLSKPPHETPPSPRHSFRVPHRRRRADAEEIASRLRVNPEFAGKVYDTITPGTMVIITDQPVVRSRRSAAVLES